MSDTEKKPDSTASEVSQNLALDKLDDKQKQEEVSSYFEKKVNLTDLQHEKQSNLRDLMDKKMEEFNRTRASSAEIIQGIIQKILEDAREKDINDVFYPEFVHQIEEVENPDLEGADDTKEEIEKNAVFKKAWAYVGGMLRTIPLTIKRQYVKEYAQQMMEQYAKGMNEKAEEYAFNWGTLKENELKQIKPLSFSEWAAEAGRPSKDELTLSINPADSKAFVEGVSAAKQTVEQLQGSIIGLPNHVTEFFIAETKAIEGFMTDNPQKAIEDAQKTMGAVKTAGALLALQLTAKEIITEIQTLKTQAKDLDPTLETGYQQIQTKVDQQLKDYMASKDPKKLDLAVLNKEKIVLDGKLAEAKTKVSATPTAREQPGEVAGPGTPGAEEIVDPMKDPEGYMKQIMAKHPFVFAILSAFGLDKIIAKVFKKKDGSAPAETETPAVAPLPAPAAGTTETPEEKPEEKATQEAAEKLAAAQKRFKDKFRLLDEEVKLLAPMKVTDLLKLTEPPRGVDAIRLENVKKALSANGADEKTEGMVIEFYFKNEKEWKEEKAS